MPPDPKAHTATTKRHDAAGAWQAIFDAIEYPMCIVDGHRKIMQANTHFQARFGGKSRTVAGKTCCQCIHGAGKPLPACPLAELAANGASARMEFGIKDRLFEEAVYPIFNGSNKANRAVHIIRDITEQANMKNLLEKKNAALSEVIAHIEHEKELIKENVYQNVSKLVLPIIRMIEPKVRDAHTIHLLKSTLSHLAKPTGRNLSKFQFNLSPREIQICNMIRQGMTMKQVAAVLGTSPQTVEKQRKHIRKKLGIADNKTNLISFLQEFDPI
ncbi:MAG: PAS domain-containing protein [Chitinivibrionales bacterium]|nr:PAS domain-containing protein [Chitinivibrionales bacterium]